jgi:RimJ/RimL family protein N-acetyltransferase
MHILSTERLIARHLSVEDANFMLELLNDPNWLRFIGDRQVRSIEQARAYILNGAVENYARLGFGFYLIERKEDGCSIGICGLTQRDYLDAPDIGFAFLPQFCGQGYAGEIASAVMAYARRELGLLRILATTRIDNFRSIALLEKLGMQLKISMDHPEGDRNLNLFEINF